MAENMNLEKNNGSSTVPPFILPSLHQDDEVESHQKQITPLVENSLSFCTKTGCDQVDNAHLLPSSDMSSVSLFQNHDSFANTGEVSTTTVNQLQQQLSNTFTTTATINAHLTPNYLQQHNDDITSTNVNQCVDEKPQTKKRRGGWPKGKKRKNVGDLIKPKAPMTGYARFINNRRPMVKSQYPDLSSAEIAKIIGSEWNALSAADKQVYLDEADVEKKRYLQELTAFQQSDAYQEFLKRQQTKKIKSFGVENLEELGTTFLPENFEEGNDSLLLFCKLCNQKFSSEHNKTEHMLGKQHLQKVTEEFGKDTMMKAKSIVHDGDNDKEKEENEGDDCSDITKLDTLSDVMEILLQRNYDREIEIRELKKNVANHETQQVFLTRELERLNQLVEETEKSLFACKSFSSTLNDQLDNLRIVPSLFGVLS